ncbi:DUF2163 domain-containing protein [Pelosinus sp. UFO1]|uniref:DUF2163 domain-containing protein n=1 Tax=Pelosinus sp. UFO1 TaxID=484770 RepID=UPI0004D1E2F8|nr:DUF2163 domain-containing protein [Pelosinus sp. UFO1]AIF51999.1 hypothetical protein UFO1_2452 [Pelosinus sp. UFO1]
MISWLQNEVTTIAWCWKLTLADGAIMGFTSHDQDILIGGVTYEAATGFTPTAVETSRDMAVDNLDVDGMIDSEKVTKEDILTGRYDGAAIQIFLCNWKNTNDPIRVIRRGTLGQISMGKQAFTAEIRGLMQAYQQQSGDIYQKTCRATIGDAKCGKSLTSYTFIGQVIAVHENGTFDTNLVNIDKYFDYGLLEFTSGNNNGKSFEIKEYKQINGKIMTFLPVTFTVAVGDTFKCIAGCDGNFSTCKNKFNNVINFRGEPHVPGNDYAASYPSQGSANTVSEGSSVKR